MILADPGPCASIVDPDGGAYLFAGHWDTLCDPTQLAAVEGVTVNIGAASGLSPDASGRVVASGLGPGDLGVEVLSDGLHYQADWVPVSLDPFPGTRVIVPLEPVSSGDGDGDGDGDGGDGGDGGDDDGGGATDGGSGTGDDVGADPDLPGDDAGFDAEVEGLGGCAVERAPVRASPLSLACLLLIGLGSRARPRLKTRRRRRSTPAGRRA